MAVKFTKQQVIDVLMKWHQESSDKVEPDREQFKNVDFWLEDKGEAQAYKHCANFLKEIDIEG